MADINKVKRKIHQLAPGTIVRLGGMTDCFQPCESEHQVTYQAIQEMNRCGIGYLIVTKSSLIAKPQYMEILDRKLAHIQITVTCLNDEKAFRYEKSSSSTQRIKAIQKLQAAEYDVSLRLSPLVEELIDFNALNSLGINKCIIEFLRINSWIKQWFQDIDLSQYTLRHGGYCHLPLDEKCRIIDKIHLPEMTVCEDVTAHYEYWRQHFNPNQEDCCNLRMLK